MHKFTTKFTKLDEEGNVVWCEESEAEFISVYRTLPDGTSEWVADFDVKHGGITLIL